PAEEPDWNKVQTLATDILLRTKDLRVVASYLTRAVIHTDGFLGCAQALLLIRGYLEQYWDTVHPQLDPDDNLDPISRINAINALSDPQTILRSLRHSPLVHTQGVGVFSLRDMDIAAGKIILSNDEEGAAPPTQAIIDGALMGSELNELQENTTAINDSLDSIKQIRKLLIDLVDVESAPQLGELTTELTHAQTVLGKELSRRGIADAVPSKSGAEVSSDDVVKAGAGGSLTSSEVNSRAEVNQMLDKICDYYTRHEPSSPVPLLLQRAKRLASMGFMELINDLASDGVSQAEKVMGVDEKKS
ncbi:Uncharacterized protein ImpA, partial [hydrothermal vent metagenome]